AMIASPCWSRRAQFSGRPTTLPERCSITLKNGSVDRKYSPIPRTSRGGSASRNIAIESIAPSQAIVLPARLAISSTRPGGPRSSSELRAQPRERGVPARARGDRVVAVRLAGIGETLPDAGLGPQLARDLLAAQSPLELRGLAARHSGPLLRKHREDERVDAR